MNTDKMIAGTLNDAIAMVEHYKNRLDETQRRLDALQDNAFRLRGMLDNHPEDINASKAYEDADEILKELESLNKLLDGGQE